MKPIYHPAVSRLETYLGQKFMLERQLLETLLNIIQPVLMLAYLLVNGLHSLMQQANLDGPGIFQKGKVLASAIGKQSTSEYTHPLQNQVYIHAFHVSSDSVLHLRDSFA